MEIKDLRKQITKIYKKDLWSKTIKAIDEYKLIEENDHIAVCISGGKDSFLLALVLRELNRHWKVKFNLSFLVMDPGYTKEALNQIKLNAEKFNLVIHIYETTIFRDTENEVSPCYLCARKRRGHLYSKARELGCNKIALGHHFDDVIETIMLNILYAGTYGSMLPKLKADNYPGMQLIRPFYLVKEQTIKRWVSANNLEFLGCACKVAEGRTDSKRKEMKELIAKLKDVYPDVDKNIFKSSENVNLNTILGYYEKERHSFLDKY